MVVTSLPCTLSAGIKHELYRYSVNQHRAGSALPFPATHLGSGQAEILSEQVNQQGSRANIHLYRLAV